MIARSKARNAEAPRPQSSCPRITSAPPRFTISPAEHGDVLIPDRYVEIRIVEDDGGPFAEKIEDLTGELATHSHESEELQAAIRARLQTLGFALPEVGE